VCAERLHVVTAAVDLRRNFSPSLLLVDQRYHQSGASRHIMLQVTELLQSLQRQEQPPPLTVRLLRAAGLATPPDVEPALGAGCIGVNETAYGHPLGCTYKPGGCGLREQIQQQHRDQRAVQVVSAVCAAVAVGRGAL
jgi:hypothetical protein